ncbi:sirohydrochlorin chelatase [Nocardioides humilatus]|uniref:Sirohydrochlorin chelatase n=1 Tax=Nocardioides humilatus TaxID=2607660 RepID=A0A5B1LJB8_9ACTN|nr:CbiX/SirB N-terminal domain-containing protein [Nocardioides humilatus]KAA1420298.1 sirohydrochlorin chelatase [Nocardioides humilatus]
MTVLVTVAHGTRNPDGNRIAAEITAEAATRLGMTAQSSYVELCAPLFADVMTDLRDDAVVVPLLLSTGFHVRSDLPTAVAAARRSVALGGPLGPDPLLAAAQVDRLVEAGATSGQPVVMVAAGSTDPKATADLRGAARLLGDLWGAPVRLATLSGLGPRLADVVRPGDAMSAYLLAPGHFADRARDEATAAGATVVTDVIGAHPRVVDLVCQRVTRMLSRAA